jgi:PHP family Zn ribbon phosphoesterase
MKKINGELLKKGLGMADVMKEIHRSPPTKVTKYKDKKSRKVQWKNIDTKKSQCGSGIVCVFSLYNPTWKYEKWQKQQQWKTMMMTTTMETKQRKITILKKLKACEKGHEKIDRTMTFKNEKAC